MLRYKPGTAQPMGLTLPALPKFAFGNCGVLYIPLQGRPCANPKPSCLACEPGAS